MSKSKPTKPKKPSAFEELAKELDVDENLTRNGKYVGFHKVKKNVFPVGGYNYMADILMLPTTKEKYKYVLSVVDLWNNDFDIEPMKNKDAATTLKGLKNIFKRSFLDAPKASMQTDGGTEFKSVFDKYLKDNGIMHKLSLPYRHRQMGNVENLNRQLGRYLMGYLTNMRMKHGKEYSEWTDIVDKVRSGLNKIRKHPKDEDPFSYPFAEVNMSEEPKYKIGDMVYHKLERPIDALNKQYASETFRTGDVRYDINEPRKVKFVLVYAGAKNPYRYLLANTKHVSYMENELIPAKETEQKFYVRQLIDKRVRNRKIEYLVWWKKHLKKDATWVPKASLQEDGLGEHIKVYEEGNKSKR